VKRKENKRNELTGSSLDQVDYFPEIFPKLTKGAV
jgi:hypothetical protein